MFADFILGVHSGLVELAILVVVFAAIWMLVEHFVTDPTIRLVVKVVGGAFLLIMAIRLLANMAGI